MSSLNQAFIKAYGKESSPATTAEATTPATPAAPTAPQSKVLGNWYSNDTWFRVDSAQSPPAPPAGVPAATSAPVASAPSAPVAPPHVPFADGYQSPSTADLGRLSPLPQRAVNEEAEYSLLPAEPVAKPELVVVDEPTAMITPPLAVTEPVTVPVVEVPAAIETKPAAVAPLEVPAPVAPWPAKMPAASDAFSLHALFAPVQVGGSWEATLGVLPAVTTALPPAPVLTPAAPAPIAKPVEQPSAKAAVPVVEPQPVVAAPAGAVPAPQVVEKPIAIEKPAPVVSVPQMRLDAALNPPVPKPHTPPAPVVEKPIVEQPAIEPPVAEKPVAAPTPAPIIAPPPPVQIKVEAPVAKAPPAVESKQPAQPSGPIQPAWEVDRFQWPEHCQQLLSAENQYLSDVGQRLSIASKDGLSILAITSTRRGEGRTTLSLCLAKAAAAAGVKVALVDGDGDNPQLVNELGVEAACGWHDVVLGKQPLSEAAILSVEDRFTFFPWTTAGALKSLNDPQVTRVLKAIASEHHLVILDLGPTPGRETRLFEDGEHCPVDAVILVRDVRWTSALEAQRVASQLISAGVGSVGIAENFGPRTSQVA